MLVSIRYIGFLLFYGNRPYGFFLPSPMKTKSLSNKKKRRVVRFFFLEVLSVNEQAMDDPNASELIKKLAEGKISQKEFDLFLHMLDDTEQAENLEEGFWALFAQFMNGNGSDPMKEDSSNN
jgi:hypothetical protein